MTTEQVQVKEPNASQQLALQQLQQHRDKGLNKSLVVLPSGAGKTFLAAFDTKQAGAKSVLFLVHRREILQQAADTFKQVHNLSDSQIGFVMQEYKEFGRPFTFSTIQTASRPKNLEILSKYKFDYVIIDEYHHVSAPSYQNILDNLNTSFLLGLTATPFRHDHKEIMSNVDGEQNMVFTMDLENGIKQKVLVPFIYNVFYDNINYTNIKFSGYKYREADLNKTLLIPSRDNLIITKFKELIQDRQAVGFCCSVKHVERMVALFNYHGIRAEGITHKTGYKSERKNIIDGFKRKDYQVLFTRDILNEGVDFPFVEALLFLRPTYSKVIFLQQLGRGLRLSPGKENVMILDFIGNYHNAYRIKDWLGFAKQNDEPVEGNKEQSRPEYIHKVAKVYFENKVIDIFDEQIRSISITPTVEQLKQNWLEVKENLGRTPFVDELNDKSLTKFLRIGIINTMTIIVISLFIWMKFQSGVNLLLILLNNSNKIG